MPTNVSHRSAEQPAPNFYELELPKYWARSCPVNRSRLLYELQLLRYWAWSRPVARIHLGAMLWRRLCRSIRAAWTLWRMEVLNRYDMLGCRGCGEFPTEATCAQCDTKWCRNCADWSDNSCWKCYRPRQGLIDCGELVFANND